MNKSERQELIREIVAAAPVASQTELVSKLRSRGVRVTQATVSRDLAELSLVRAGSPGRKYYQPAPGFSAEPAELLRRMVGEFVSRAAASGVILVLRTAPATANVVAGAIDKAGLAGVLGTVAGDDTVMVVTDRPATAGKLKNQMEKWLGESHV